MNKSLSELQVVGVRYLGGLHIPGTGIPLTEYRNSGIFKSAKVPFSVAEPFIPEDEQTQDEVTNIGLLGGKIAEVVAMARRKDHAVLMAGGNCCHITGVIGGLQDVHGPGARIGLVWFDAHGDFNTVHTTLSRMLGGMPVAVAAGLTLPTWREHSHITSPIPTNRIILVDVRNLDPAEEALIRATDTMIAAPAVGFPGDDLKQCLDKLVNQVDMIYLHIDSDILDETYTPNHKTKEPDGPNMDQVTEAIDLVMSTGKVAAYAVVSVSGKGEGADVMIESGKELIRAGLRSWSKHGMV